MISVSKKLFAPSIIKSSTFISTAAKHLDERLPFIPFPHLQQIKRLESQLISTLENCRSLAQLKQTHAFIVRQCLHQSSYIIAKLVRMLSKLSVSPQSYAAVVFNQVNYPNAFLYTALIRGYLVDGSLEESVLVYNSMRSDGLTPLTFTIAGLLKRSAFESNADLGRQLHGESVKLGKFGDDLFVENTLIEMYVKCGMLDCGRKVFDEMPERDSVSWTSLIDAYAKAGEMDRASALFCRMPGKDVVPWTVMVTGFARNAMPMEALEYFVRMQTSGVQTDAMTLVGVINACAQTASIKYANWVRNVAERSGFSPEDDAHLCSALIDMHSKCGSLEDTYNVFNSTRQKSVYSYSCMIMGFAMHGRARSAIELFSKMLTTDVKPNSITFLAVLTACSHGGLVELGQHIFEHMEKSCGVPPNVDHYSCIVDLLGRAGQLVEAFNVATSMPFKANASVWGALLGASRTHANPDVAEVAAARLFELEPDNIGNYILLCDTYAKAGRWDEVARVRKLMRTKGLRKNSPAFSWVEGEKGVVLEFYAGDRTNVRYEETKEVLEKLVEKARENGYETQLKCAVYDVNEEEKRRMLMNHSEKLALAYALLVSGEDDGNAIRIVKNLRICEDCHVFMCCASKVCGRQIIVRDNMRFHHFRDGACSCSSFW